HNGILEHVYPAFFKAMSHPDQIGMTLSIYMAGSVLGGSSYFMALLFGGAWAGLIYYCCYEIYESYRLRRMTTNMADIQASFLDNSDNSFWVAEEREQKGRWLERRAIWRSRRDRPRQERCSNGEVPHLIVSFECCKKGTQMAQTVMEVCKECGFFLVVLETSSPQTVAYAVYSKLGFIQTSCHSYTHANRSFSKMMHRGHQSLVVPWLPERIRLLASWQVLL
uniref:N-acetyltransferase domain-containing protein n=1 Tax=Hucho hucho TaxID=62062 RepID=A0A4W5ML20_9TELE